MDESNTLFENIKKEKFKLDKDHNIPYEEHSYVYKNLIEQDYENLSKATLKKKLTDYKYLKPFLRIYLYKHEEIGRLIELFKQEFGDIQINYNLIPKEETKNIINKFKQKRKGKDYENITIQDIINLKNLAIGAINNFKYKNNVMKNFETEIENFKINEKNVVTKLEVIFKRKSKTYKKYSYCILTKEMEDNLINKNISQYFGDVTYYCTPPNKHKYRLFILMGFNKEKYKTVLCNISLICNENMETFKVILEHLKLKYNFHPNKITLDFSKAEYYAFKIVYKDIIIIPCFYHYCKNIIRNLPELKSKTKTIKKQAIDLFDNMKLICFIEVNNIDSFYEEIKYKYSAKFTKFFKYFENFYFKKKPFSDKCWNYHHEHFNDDNNIIFYTNNIVESCNRTLNSKFIRICKTLYHFKKAIRDLIDIYDKHPVYQEKKLCITRALEHYVKRNEIINLITHNDFELLKESYKKYLNKNKLSSDDKYISSEEEEKSILKNIIDSEESVSSDSEELDNNPHTNNSKYNHDRDDGDGDGDGDNESKTNANKNMSNIDKNVSTKDRNSKNKKRKNNQNKDQSRNKTSNKDDKLNNNILSIYNSLNDFHKNNNFLNRSESYLIEQKDVSFKFQNKKFYLNELFFNNNKIDRNLFYEDFIANKNGLEKKNKKLPFSKKENIKYN
mgnify:CR=1 FL=1